MAMRIKKNCQPIKIEKRYLPMQQADVIFTQQLSTQQRLFLVEEYFASKSYKHCQQRFGQRFPDVQVPNKSTIVRLIQRFRDQGSVADRSRSGRLTLLTPAVLHDVQQRFQQSPKKSPRRMSQETSLSVTTPPTSHTAGSTMALLHNLFGERVISKDLWPPRSPDLTSPDYFLWGYLKERVYENNPLDLDSLKANILQAIHNITPYTLQRVSANMRKRVNLCLQEAGEHFQHML
jgi:transposase